MSGFLERLASGVLRANRAIHPSVGSIWSGPRNGEAIESSSEILAPQAPRRADAPPRLLIEQRPHAAAQNTDQPKPAPPAAQPAIAESVVFKPLVVVPQQDTFVAGQSELTLPPHREELPREQEQHTNTVRPWPIVSPSHLVPTIKTPASPVSANRTSPSFMPPQRLPSSRPIQSAQRTSSESDSIEIHIGRIEVLAAPQRVAQTATPARPRKSVDLAEYLRRDRRAK
jgi:hypothetical protein